MNQGLRAGTVESVPGKPGKYRRVTASSRLTWDEIGERHPGLYGDPEVHGDAADGADGEGIGWAAAHLAFNRPGHDEHDEGSWDLDFHLQDVPVHQIDYARAGMDDPRVRSARRWYQEAPDEVVPPVLVHRHGVYQVADGHHRSEAAAYWDLPTIPAYVAQSPHEDEPFSDGARGPYHGAEPVSKTSAAIPDESGLKAAGIAVIAMDTGRVLMQQRALNPLLCPCGLGVTWDESNGYQHEDGSVSHDNEFYGQSVSDLLDQGHPQAYDGDNDEEGVDSEEGLDKTAALEFDLNEGTWEFPGGKMDEGESPRAAAIREFREEVGQDLPPGVFVSAWVSPGGLVTSASFEGDSPGLTAIAVQPGQQEYGYGSGHTAPVRQEGAKNTLDNMDDMLPDYLEHPEWYGEGGSAAEWEAHDKARRARGNPDKRIRIYRAVPHGISKIYGNAELRQMFPDQDPSDLSEWVSTSKTYAQQHAYSEACPKCRGKLQVITGIARAGDLVNEGYPTEFGYVGEHTLEHSGANRVYKTKCPAPRKTEEQRDQEYLDSLDENDQPTEATHRLITGRQPRWKPSNPLPGHYQGSAEWFVFGDGLSTTSADLPRRGPSEPPAEHVQALISSGWKPRHPEQSLAHPDFTKLSPTTGINHQISWARDTGNAWMYDATVPHEEEFGGRRTISPNDPNRTFGGRGSIPLVSPEHVNAAAKKFEQQWLFGGLSEHGIMHHFEPDADMEMMWGRSPMAYERLREGNPVTGTHPEHDVKYMDFDPDTHEHDEFREDPHAGGLGKLNAVKKSPVYKCFIYLIQNERDIDLGNREIANPDDPDGDMTEQSAWWDIEHAKKNPALRAECKKGTPWAELELWADKSVRANREVKEAFAKLAILANEAAKKPDKCMYCKSPATKEIVHSEGIARIPVCGDHLGKGKEDAANCTPDGSHDPSNIDSIREASAKTAMPTTQDEPGVHGFEGSGEGALNRKVTLPSGEWLAKTPHYEHMNDEAYQSPEDAEYFRGRSSEDADMEEFASRFGRALSDPDDEPITPEVIRGTKVSDPGPTAYVRRYPEFRDMDNGWLDHDDLEHHTKSPRGRLMGYFHSVLADGDHVDHHNMLLLGDPMERETEKIHRMPTVSIDHTHSSIPAFAEAMASGDQDMTWLHRGELSPYEEHFLGYRGTQPVRKQRNPLAPGDTERALAATETMRPWAQERGREDWLAAAQHRMVLLGQKAAGTESMFPYKMHHELGFQHEGSVQKTAVTWINRGVHPECGCTVQQMKLMDQHQPVQGWMTDHRPHGGRVRWRVTKNGLAQEQGKARRSFWAEKDMLEAYDRVVNLGTTSQSKLGSTEQPWWAYAG